MIEKSNVLIEKLITCAMKLFDKFETQTTAKFLEIFKTFNGGTFQSKYYVSKSKNKLITIKNVDDSGFNTLSVSYLSDEKAEKKYLLNIGDIILTMTGNIGRVGIVDEEDCYLNQRVLKIESTSKLYLFCFLLKYKKKIVVLGKGTAQLNLSLNDLNNIIVKNNSCDVTSFSKYDALFEKIVNTKLQLKKLTKVKELLLSKYF